MITAQELRIGNVIWHTCNNINNGKVEDVPVTVDGNLIKELELHPYLGYNPIPISPELLERAGFKWKDEEIKDDGSKITYYTLGRVTVRVVTAAGIFFFPYKRLEHLHQLQNLFFALTGSELQIDL